MVHFTSLKPFGTSLSQPVLLEAMSSWLGDYICVHGTLLMHKMIPKGAISYKALISISQEIGDRLANHILQRCSPMKDYVGKTLLKTYDDMVSCHYSHWILLLDSGQDISLRKARWVSWHLLLLHWNVSSMATESWRFWINTVCLYYLVIQRACTAISPNCMVRSWNIFL